MAEDSFTLTTFYGEWKLYQDHVRAALAPLTSEQLALRAAPGLRSIGENAMHIIGCRMYWFTEFLGEDGGEEMKGYTRWNEVALEAPYASWNEVALALGAPVPTAAELAQGLDRTWHLMADCLARWSPAGMRQTSPTMGMARPSSCRAPGWSGMCSSTTCTTAARSRSPSACTGSTRNSPAEAPSLGERARACTCQRVLERRTRGGVEGGSDAVPGEIATTSLPRRSRRARR